MMGRAYLRCESESGPARAGFRAGGACIADRLTPDAVARANAIIRSQTRRPFEKRVYPLRGKKALKAAQAAEAQANAPAAE